MTDLSASAQSLYDALPEDGSMLSGGKLRLAVVMSNTEFDEAKAELRASGLVEVGRGRGGTFGRLTEASTESPQDEEPKVPTLQERAAIAREAKTVKTTQRKRSDALKERIRTQAQRELDVPMDRIKVRAYGGWEGVGVEPYIEVTNKPGGKGGAQIYRLRNPDDWMEFDEHGFV